MTFVRSEDGTTRFPQIHIVEINNNCKHNRGKRSINTFSETYIARCSNCNYSRDYDFEGKQHYSYVINFLHEIEVEIFTCNIHQSIRNHDFLGDFCVWCEVEEILEFKNDPLPEEIIKFIANDVVYSDLQCQNCMRISSEASDYHRIHDSLKCICHLYPGVDLS